MNSDNFLYLFAALLLLLIAAPIAEHLQLASPSLARMLTFSTLLAVGVWSLRGSTGVFRAGMGLAAAGIVLSIAAGSSNSAALSYASLVAVLSFLILANAYAFRRVVFSRNVSTNRLTGAVCVYLMLGAIWALVYALIDAIVPGSYTGLTASPEHPWSSDWLYFSFVTMTTLGYGDFSPISSPARVAAYMQAVFGQLYIAILVAGLVGAYLTEHLSADE